MTDGLYPRDAERACLGAAILDNRFIRGPLSCLAVQHFALSAHAEIFALMLDFDQEGSPFDILVLEDSLRQRNTLETIGGLAYLIDLTDGVVVHSRLIERHAKTVVRCWQLRELSAGVRKSEAVALRHPVMPVADRLGG